MNKEASKAKVISSILGAIGLPVGMDVLQHDDFSLDSFDKKRIGNAILNAAIGAGSGFMGGSGKAADIIKATGLATMAPAKDLLINLQDTPNKVNEAVDSISQNSAINNKLMLGLGAGALGLGTVGLIKYLMTKDPKTDMGSIKFKLPGKKDEPGTEAEISLPVDMPEMSPSLIEGLNRGVRQQARKNVKANSMKRDLETGKLIPMDEWEAKYGDEDMYYAQRDLMKAASTREWAEGAGTMLTGIMGASVGSALGRRLSGATTPEQALLGSLAGAAVGGFGPHLLGKLIANILSDRTDTEQYHHDKGNPMAEYFIPGYASYQSERRDNQVEDPEKYKNKLSFANTLASDEGFDSSDYVLDKYAAAAPPPPPAPAPAGPPPPPPLKPKHSQRLAGNTPPPSDEERFTSTGVGTVRGKCQRASTAVRNAARRAVKMASTDPYTIELYKRPSSLTKSASTALDMSAREEARGIMKKIYDEDPSYWPYGLDIPGHESLYIVRDNMTKQAAGFVGWQELVERGRRVGSYSIGILPEYRNRGFAKEAVAKILQIKSANVDEVRAYVMPHNKPSHNLADSLGVKVQESF